MTRTESPPKRLTGCMTCMGDTCQKCRHWQHNEERSRRTQWGLCVHFTADKSLMRIYSGNIDFDANRPEVYTTSLAKCRYFEGVGT